MKRFAAIGATVVLILGVVYLFFDPTYSPFAPKCIFRLLTGYDCPACGGQRALHALLNGEIAQAIGYNPYLIIAVPYLLAVAYTTYGRSDRAQRWRNYIQHRYTIITFLVLTIAWWVGRNVWL